MINVAIQAPEKISGVTVKSVTASEAHYNLAGKQALLANTGANPVYISNATGVTTGTGFPIAAGTVLSSGTIKLTGDIYYISNSTSTLVFLELGSI